MQGVPTTGCIRMPHSVNPSITGRLTARHRNNRHKNRRVVRVRCPNVLCKELINRDISYLLLHTYEIYIRYIYNIYILLLLLVISYY